MPTLSRPPPASPGDLLDTTLIVEYPAALGELVVRGEPDPLTWQESLRSSRVEDGKHVFTMKLPAGEVFAAKVMDGKERFSQGRNYTFFAGETLRVVPHFERGEGRLLHAPVVTAGLTARIWVPASYDERKDLRYPTLYVLDGQAALTDALPGEASWGLDATLDALADIRAIDEPVLVAIHTNEERLRRLAPVRDPEVGDGGGAAETLAALCDHLVPYVDAHFRTRAVPGERTILGASMGGLFAYGAGRARGDVFGKVACLSPSFWWAGRHAVREAQQAICPVPRPVLYIDAGAPIDAFEKDVGKRDGYADMTALRDALVGHCYEPGKDIFALSYPGAQHDSASWAARLAIPLQLMLPRRD